MCVSQNSVIAAGVLCLLATSPIVPQTATLVGIAIADSLGTLSPAPRWPIVSSAAGDDDHLGEFRFSRLPAGLLMINVRRLGFVPRSDTVTLAENVATNSATSSERPGRATRLGRVTMPERHIPAGLTEFEERRKEGRGYFVSEVVVFARTTSCSMLDVIVANVPGLTRLRTNPRKPSEYYVGTTRKQPDYDPWPARDEATVSPVTPYRRAILPRRAAIRISDLTSFAVRDHVGVEYYPGGATAPVKYNATDSAAVC